MFFFLAEVAGSKTGIEAEEAVKIGRVFKAEEVGYLLYAMVGVYQQAFGF